MRGRVAIVGALLLLLAWSAPAQALPGDEPFGPVSPPDGATFAPDPAGIPVTFTCPVYRSSSAGLGFTIYGGIQDYGVGFATAPALGSDGRLLQSNLVALDNGHTSNTVPQGQCSATFAAGGSQRPQEQPGTYWWQVWRLCVGCDGGYEVGPVRKLVLRTPGRPAVQLPARAYAGYPAIVGIRLEGVADGARATLERRAGNGWKAVGSDTTLKGAVEVIATLPRGRQRLRAVIRSGEETLVGAERALDVRAARGWTTGAADGSYSGRLGVRFTVTGGGRVIRGFEADVPMLCPGVVAGQFTTQLGHAALRRIAVAPDGSFVGAASRDGSTMLVRGRLAGGRVVAGSATLGVGNCTGTASFGAAR